MEIIPTNIPDVLRIRPRVFEDDRGFFMESFNEEKFQKAVTPTRFIQDNHSGSHKGVLRGLHFQSDKPQGKLVRVVAGEVFDVAVDLRQSSPTYGKWVGVVLSAKNKEQLWVPVGFAHGFLVLSDWAEFVYKVDAPYSPSGEKTLLWNDPAVGIDWPKVAGNPILAGKDREGQLLKDLKYFS